MTGTQLAASVNLPPRPQLNSCLPQRMRAITDENSCAAAKSISEEEEGGGGGRGGGRRTEALASSQTPASNDGLEDRSLRGLACLPEKLSIESDTQTNPLKPTLH